MTSSGGSAGLATLAELVRLPAALTVPGDTLAGAASGGALDGSLQGALRSAALMPVASVCLYWSGMALNDWADRDLDAVERPERPIPSGRISPRAALAVAGGLSAAGLAAAHVAGGAPAVRTAALLTATVWAYDLVLKNGPAGPVAMAAARGLDVVLGAGGSPRAAAAPAVLMAGHTAAVTALSRGEVHGAAPATARGALARHVVTAVAAGLRGRTGRRPALLPAALAGAYALAVGRAQARAVRDPAAGPVRAATGAGIKGMVPLQASLVAGSGSPRTAIALLAAGPLAQAAFKRISFT
ncbi:UbiA family prenyltransferase [Nocardioides marinquilinus]|uniref:UbiA family prenyltransferase n=1 Tax=Nocardioides marinquilinus TaxID=1210400 RepID=A0ABP9PF01_9ACTN